MCPEAPYPGSAAPDMAVCVSIRPLCVSSISLVSMSLVTRPGSGFRGPCKSRLSPSDGLLNESTLVSTIHKLALRFTEMQVLTH